MSFSLQFDIRLLELLVLVHQYLLGCCLKVGCAIEIHRPTVVHSVDVIRCALGNGVSMVYGLLCCPDNVTVIQTSCVSSSRVLKVSLNFKARRLSGFMLLGQ